MKVNTLLKLIMKEYDIDDILGRKHKISLGVGRLVGLLENWHPNWDVRTKQSRAFLNKFAKQWEEVGFCEPGDVDAVLQANSYLERKHLD